MFLALASWARRKRAGRLTAGHDARILAAPGHRQSPPSRVLSSAWPVIGHRGIEARYRTKRHKTPKLHRIDIRPITHSPDHVTQYAGKALRSWQFTEDDMLILPESMRERAQQAPLTDAEARRIRDIQSRFNVSDDVARAMLGNRRLAG
jgi:hypothetical protein